MKEIQPRILAFLCNWAGYAAHDLAGTKFVRLPLIECEIRVMCTGRVDPSAVIEGLMNGFDGVMVMGCRKGECRYENGNFYAGKRIYWIGKTLERIGMNPKRVCCNWVGADDEETFKKHLEEFTGAVRPLGVIGEAEDMDKEEAIKRLAALKEVFDGERMRWLIGKEMELAGGADVFGEPLSRAGFENSVMEVFESEYGRNLILKGSSDSAKSVPELSEVTGMNSDRVVREIVVLKRLGKIFMEEIRNRVPVYKGSTIKD
ncbi:MAG: hydrogenase iron-sulfur subunit [Deltaproteobacteria bacterium]|nr:hydrogenase iron-sulfur subunit [Deltaproteobacteria bacterium]